jgi:hypothetical protein
LNLNPKTPHPTQDAAAAEHEVRAPCDQDAVELFRFFNAASQQAVTRSGSGGSGKP